MNLKHWPIHWPIHWLIRGLIALSLVLNLPAASLGGAPTAKAQDTSILAAGDENWDNRFGLPGVEGGEVNSVAVTNNGDIYIAGRFTQAGNIDANHIARWDGNQFHALGEGLNDVPSAIVTDGTNIYAVGSFTSAGFVSANGIARWNGTEWSAVGTGEGLLLLQTVQAAGKRAVPAAAFANGAAGFIGGRFDEE